MSADVTPTPPLNLDAVRALRAQLLALVPEQSEAGVRLSDAVLSMMTWMELAQAELTTLRARVEDADAVYNDMTAVEARRYLLTTVREHYAAVRAGEPDTWERGQYVQAVQVLLLELAAATDKAESTDSALAGVQRQNEQAHRIIQAAYDGLVEHWGNDGSTLTDDVDYQPELNRIRDMQRWLALRGDGEATDD